MFSKASIAFSTASRQSFNIRGQNIREELRSLEPSAPIDQRISLYETLYQVGQSNTKENLALVHFLLQSGSLRKAIKLLISEIRKEPFNLQLLVRLKSVLSDFNRPFLSNLIKDYILKRIPDSIQKFEALADHFIASNESHSALSILNQIPEQSFIKSLNLVNKRLNCLFFLNRLDEVIAEGSKIFRSYPRNSAIIYILIQTYVRRGELEEAIALYYYALQCKIFDPKIIRLGNVLKIHSKLKFISSSINVEHLHDLNHLNIKSIPSFLSALIQEKRFDLVDYYLELYGDKLPARTHCALRSEIAFYDEEYEECVRQCRRHLIFESGNVNTYLRLGVAYAYLEKYEFALECVNKAFKLRPKLEFTFSYPIFQIYTGAGNYEKSFSMYSYYNLNNILNKVYPNRFDFFRQNTNEKLCKILIVAVGGPGDELRFCRLYEQLIEKFSENRLFVTCEPRLWSILNRSYPEITFVPVQRFRIEQPFNSYTGRERVSNNTLSDLINNECCDLINEDGFIYSILELIPVLRPRREDFPLQVRNLSTDENLKEKFHKIFVKFGDSKKVGIAWRSGLLSNARNHHYLTADEVATLFKNIDVCIINLQHDLEEEEKVILKSSLGDRFIDLNAEVDLRDNFEETCALLANLDLVISPCTTMAETAGACGVKTWMFSNSPMNNYRTRSNEIPSDLWHPNLEIVRGNKFGDKISLVRVLEEKLLKQINL